MAVTGGNTRGGFSGGVDGVDRAGEEGFGAREVAAGECSWTAISPLHREYPLGAWNFSGIVLVLYAACIVAGLAAIEVAGWRSRASARSKAGGAVDREGLLCGIKSAGSRGQRPRSFWRRALMGAAMVAAAFHGMIHLVGLFSSRGRGGWGGEGEGWVGGGGSSSSSSSTMTHPISSLGSVRRPKVVVMMPTRKDLHPVVTGKAFACLEAMKLGNPELDLDVFIFDRVVPRVASDKRPLSKVSRIRNMMIAEAGVETNYDYTLWLDSDIVEYPPDLPTRLIRENPHGITAPLVLIEEPGPLGTDQFYDTTAFVKRHMSKVSDDTSPFVKGRNIDRFYPYLMPRSCDDDRLDWQCAMHQGHDVDSVGTIYMVNADIFRVGKAVFADHPSFTEHYPLMEHAWRMGRRVVVTSRSVARHANLPFYGESFHENVIISGGDFPSSLGGAQKADMATWASQITSAYCKELGRLPDAGGMLSYMEHLQNGVAYIDGKAVAADETFVRSVLSVSGEAKALLERESAGQGRFQIQLNFSSTPARRNGLFSVVLHCHGIGCMGAGTFNIINGVDCTYGPILPTCLSPGALNDTTGTSRVDLSILTVNVSTIGGTARGSNLEWEPVEGVLMGHQHIQLLGEETVYYRSLSVVTPGVYRMRASLKRFDGSRDESFEAVVDSSTFLVVPEDDSDLLPTVRGATGMNAGVTRERQQHESRYVVLAHSSAFSKASARQLLSTIQQSKRVHRGWNIRVYIDDSLDDSLGSELITLGAELVNAQDFLPDEGEFTWAFWPFLAAEDSSVSRFIVREAGYDVVERERGAVGEWITSQRQLHVARDSSLHDRPFNIRAWGCTFPCRSGLVDSQGGMRNSVISFLSMHGAAVRTDAWFGDTVIWPSFISGHEALAHDSFSCEKYAGSLPFPTQRVGTDFVGQQSKSWMQVVGQTEGESKGSDGDSQEWDPKKYFEDVLNEEKAEWTCQRAPLACRKELLWAQG